MLRVKNNLLPIGIQSLFTINSNSYNTRQSGKFDQKYVRTTMKSMTVSVAGAKLWYSLKTNIIIHTFADFESIIYVLLLSVNTVNMK